MSGAYAALSAAHGAQAALPPALPAALCWRINHLGAYLQLRSALGDAATTGPKDVLIVGAGPAGLDLIERLLTQLPAHCRAGCLVALEIGYNQGKAVQALVHSSLPGATQFVLRQDYQGHDRIVTFRL